MVTKEVYAFDLKRWDKIKFSNCSATTIIEIGHTPGGKKIVTRLSNGITLHLSKQQFLDVILEF